MSRLSSTTSDSLSPLARIFGHPVLPLGFAEAMSPVDEYDGHVTFGGILGYLGL